MPIDSDATIIDGAITADIDGIPGAPGKSAYELAVLNGYTGTLQQWLSEVNPQTRVTTLDDTYLTEHVIEAVGNPVYVSDDTLEQYAQYNITKSGWYVIARIAPKPGVTASDAVVEGASGVVLAADHVDVAIEFEVASVSKVVRITWGGETEIFVFKATDLAIRNLDYRVTFYLYDIAPYTTWEYALTADATFAEGKYYYTKDENDNYTLAEVTAGEAVPADTYYVHSKVTFAGMVRNITYVCNIPVDCPQQYTLPEIEDETHGCWFEVRLRHTGTFSSTLVVPEGVKVATEHTQAETAGINMVDLHYTAIGGLEVWRFMNTHSTIPA